jgi:ATP-dependent helicase STH1/SNF2
MTKVTDIMEDFLKMMSWKHLRLDGRTKTDDRASFVQMFNAKDSEYKVFILSTGAGGLGLRSQPSNRRYRHRERSKKMYSCNLRFIGKWI